MTNNYEVGDKLRYLGGDSDANNDLTAGKIYEVHDADFEGNPYIYDDTNYAWAILPENKFYYELEKTESTGHTPVEASPTVIELLANISRRLYEAEAEIKDLQAQVRTQTYEINELYKVVANRG